MQKLIHSNYYSSRIMNLTRAAWSCHFWGRRWCSTSSAFRSPTDGWLLHVKPRNNNKTVLLCKKHGFHCLASWVTGSAQVTIWPRKTCSGASSFDPILPEGHREPHGHHHVGGAAVLGGENSLEITPYLEEQTRGYRHRGETHRERNNKYTVH